MILEIALITFIYKFITIKPHELYILVFYLRAASIAAAWKLMHKLRYRRK